MKKLVTLLAALGCSFALVGGASATPISHGCTGTADALTCSITVPAHETGFAYVYDSRGYYWDGERGPNETGSDYNVTCTAIGFPGPNNNSLCWNNTSASTVTYHWGPMNVITEQHWPTCTGCPHYDCTGHGCDPRWQLDSFLGGSPFTESNNLFSAPIPLSFFQQLANQLLSYFGSNILVVVGVFVTVMLLLWLFRKTMMWVRIRGRVA